MIWNYSDASELKMKNLTEDLLTKYLNKIKTETLLSYGVYQIEAGGLELFDYVKGDRDSIMGLPIKEIPLPEGASVGAVVRHGELIMPSSNVELSLNDHLIIFLSDKNMVNEVEALFKSS